MSVFLVIQLPANGLQKQVSLRTHKEVQDLDSDDLLLSEEKTKEKFRLFSYTLDIIILKHLAVS